MYRTVILLFVSCGHETSSLRLREGRRSRVFDNRVLRKIFGPKRDEVTGKRRRLIHSQSARKEFVTLSLSLLKMCSSQQYTCGTLIFIQHVWNPLCTDLCLPGLLVRISNVLLVFQPLLHSLCILCWGLSRAKHEYAPRVAHLLHLQMCHCKEHLLHPPIDCQ